MARKLTVWIGGLALLLAVAGLVGCAVSTSVLPSVSKHPGYTAGTACDATGCHDTYKHQEPYLGPCQDCHTLERWKPAVYSHKDTSFDNGMHTIIGCAMCHTEGEPLPSAKCTACHDPAPHAGSTTCVDCHTTTAWGLRKPLPDNHVSLLGGHKKLECFDCHTAKPVKDKPRACVDCHGTNHGGLRNCQDCHAPATGWEPKDGWSHDPFFKITGQHKKLDCTQCHTNGRFAGTPKVCVGCHGKKHGGLTNCASCHTTAGFKPSTFRHSSVFALTGRHAKLDCTKCHTTRGAYARVVGGGSHRCVDCHGSRHGGLTNCANCHTTAGFENATFKHATVFPLTGRHAELACSKCHTGGEFVVKGTHCVDCHGVQHGGLRDCADCHTTAGFSNAHFTHPRSFPLTGAHDGPSCGACHETALKFLPAPNPNCVTCHAGVSPHGAGVTQCKDCHTPTTWSNVSVTVHPYHTMGTPPRPCATCHPGNDFSAPVPCSNCHTAPHVVPTNCRSCHVPSGPWSAVNFSHQQIDGFGQTNVHASTDFGPYPAGCANCHTTGTIPNFGTYSCTAAGCHV